MTSICNNVCAAGDADRSVVDEPSKYDRLTWNNSTC